MEGNNKYILTLSCADTVGIVAAVSGFLAENKCFISELSQWGDISTGTFFMRCVFQVNGMASSYDEVQANFNKVSEKFNMDWAMHDMSYKPKVLIMVSKLGHCLNDLLHRFSAGNLNVEIPAIVSNHKDMEKMASFYDIPFHHFPITAETKPEQEEKVLQLVKDLDIDLVVLARYMQVLSPSLVSKLHGRAINIHHSFLPGFKGAKPYHQAFDRGVKIIGATAHYVSDELDEGPIIEQEVQRVDHTHTPDQLLANGRDIESLVLSRAVNYHVEHRIILNGTKTVVFK